MVAINRCNHNDNSSVRFDYSSGDELYSLTFFASYFDFLFQILRIAMSLKDLPQDEKKSQEHQILENV